MGNYSSDRRSVLKIFGAIGATCAYPFSSDELYGQQAVEHHQHKPAPQPADTQPHFFNKTDFSTIGRVAELIIPETDTPGAIGAGVPAYIDLVVARNTDQQLVVADGLRWLDAEAGRVAGKKFLDLSETQQLAILEPLCEAADIESGTKQGRNVQFFALMKNLTADGYYTSRTGLVDELRYQPAGMQPIYPVCSDQR